MMGRRTMCAAAATVALGAALAATPASGATPANEGEAYCVTAGTPVDTGPGTGTFYTMTAGQAWHVYTHEANQWTQGYVSRTDPVVRGWVWGGHFTGPATDAPGGGSYCP